ncbi:MAG: tRNA-binding protein [Salibacteraceae bacterium]
MTLELFERFMSLDFRIGTIIRASDFPEARKPAWKLEVDFGSNIGVLKSSAQITEHYTSANLIGKQVIGLVNLPPKQIGSFQSQCLILGVYAEDGVVLLTTDKPCKNGDKIG